MSQTHPMTGPATVAESADADEPIFDPNSLLARLETASGPAIDFGSGDALTYPDLWKRACRFAGGLPPSDVALIFAPTSSAAAVAFIGCMIAGILPSFMPLPSPKQDPAVFWDAHRALFRHVGAGLIISPDTFHGEIRMFAPDNPLGLLAIDEIDGELTRIVDRREAFLQHSSGTTGLKKGVVVTHEQLVGQLTAYRKRIGLTRESVVVSWLPLYHDMGLVACFLLPLFTGCRVVMIDPFRWNTRPRLLLEAIDRERGTHVWMPNFAFLYMAMLEMPHADLSSMRMFVNCSEQCSPRAFERFLEAFGKMGVRPDMLTCSYAMAETVFAVTQSAGAPMARAGVLSSGRMIEGLELRIVDENGRAAQSGEIELRGPLLFDGYFKDAARTASAFREGWYRTRDIGFVHDGELFVLGRTDDTIIVNGRNLFAHEIEAAVCEVQGVAPGRAVAFAMEKGDLTALVVVCECGEGGKAGDLAGHVATRISSVFAIVPHVSVVPPKTLLKTTSGKMDRRRNQARYAAGDLSPWG